jgi:uncharacterized protein (UPF0332 family)
MDPIQLQYLASRLSEQGTSPVEFRTAINRAYYSVFHVGLKHLDKMGFKLPSTATAHEHLPKYLNNCGDEELEKVAAKLKDLKAKRKHADYDLKRTDVEKKVNSQMQVKLSIRLIESMNNRCKGENSKKIINSILQWKKLSKI